MTLSTVLNKTKPYIFEIHTHIMSKTNYLNKLDLPNLKKIDQTKKAEINKKEQLIASNLNDFSISVKLPKTVLERYEKQFGTKRVNAALKTAIVCFAIILLFLLYLQPSIMFQSAPEKMVLKNNSQRTIKHVTIYALSDLTTALFIFDELGGGEEITFEVNNGGGYIAIAERQFPAFGFATQKDNKGENSTNIANPLEKSLEEIRNGNPTE